MVILFLVTLGLELRALLGIRSTTLFMPLALFALAVFQSGFPIYSWAGIELVSS
jgi:hypothetical protein